MNYLILVFYDWKAARYLENIIKVNISFFPVFEATNIFFLFLLLSKST